MIIFPVPLVVWNCGTPSVNGLIIKTIVFKNNNADAGYVRVCTTTIMHGEQLHKKLRSPIHGALQQKSIKYISTNLRSID